MGSSEISNSVCSCLSAHYTLTQIYVRNYIWQCYMWAAEGCIKTAIFCAVTPYGLVRWFLHLWWSGCIAKSISTTSSLMGIIWSHTGCWYSKYEVCVSHTFKHSELFRTCSSPMNTIKHHQYLCAYFFTPLWLRSRYLSITAALYFNWRTAVTQKWQVAQSDAQELD